MTPVLPVEREVVFKLRRSDVKLRAQVLRVRTDSDFITSQGSTKQDVGFFAFGDRRTGSGVAVAQFYVGASVVKDFQLGDDVHIRNSAGQQVVVVSLGGPTTVS